MILEAVWVDTSSSYILSNVYTNSYAGLSLVSIDSTTVSINV